jgi:hypothetical protein
MQSPDSHERLIHVNTFLKLFSLSLRTHFVDRMSTGCHPRIKTRLSGIWGRLQAFL